MHNRLFLFVLSLSFGCGDDPAEKVNCAGEQSDVNRVPTAVPPDWEEVVLFPKSSPLGRVQDGASPPDEIEYREHIQAWDCIQLSWWTPSSPMKVVQVWTDETSCEHFESSMVETFDCDSHDGMDDLYRDSDGDGYYASEGDCDDQSDIMAPNLQERCDSIDNDCDGVSDEYLDCSDIEAFDEGM